MTLPVGIRSIGLSFPSIIRTNDYYRQNYPDLIAQVEQKSLSKVFSLTDNAPNNEFDQEMLPYLSDPFRGSVERRVLGPGETSLTLSYRAAIDALEAAKLSAEEIDLMLVATIHPEQIVPGNAAALAGQLGLRGAAWNLDSTCSNATVALQTACALIRAGEYHNVLVVICTNYSPFTDENDTLSFLSGDGAGAFVVGSLKPKQGVLGTKIINTASTCGTFFNELTTDAQGNPRMFIRSGKGAAQMLSDTAIKFVRECSEGALAAAGVTKEEILDKIVERIIQERRYQSRDDSNDVLSMLLNTCDENGERMSDEELHDEIMTIFSAGFETSAAVLSWIWYLLSQHPSVEQKLYAEISTVLDGRAPTIEDLPKLQYTKMVVQESMRLYPGAWVFTRNSMADDEIDGYHIPANSMILLSPFVTHRLSTLWEKPEQFYPEHFLPEKYTGRPRYAYYPFGGGPRQCLGDVFAMTEIQLVVAMVAQRYRLHLIPEHPVEMKPLLTLQARHDILVTLESRYGC